MPAVQTQNTISLDGKYFRIRGPVDTFIASGFPPKTVSGDFTLSAHPLVSTQVWNDHRPGIGKDIFDPDDPGRSWWSTLSNRYRGHLVLQRRSVQTAAASSSGTVGFINEISTSVFASFGTAVHAYDNTIDSWGSSVRTLAGAATDSIRCTLNGADTLVVAQGTDIDWTTDGSSWSRDTTDIKYVAYWRDLLWGITAAGQLYFTANLASGFTAMTTLKLPSGAVTDLVEGPGPNPDMNTTVLYATTTYGLYVYDSEQDRFIATDLQVPYHPNNGRGTKAWRGALYFPAGNAVYEYRPGATTVIRVIGPDRDDGLPSDRRGSITTMVTTHNDLIIGVDSSIGTTSFNTFATDLMGTQRQNVFPVNNGIPTLLGWAGGAPPEGQGGWESKWASGTTGNAIEALFVSNQYSSYRLYWGSSGRIFYQSLPTDIVNPSQITTTEYESSGTYDTPWFEGEMHQTKLALQIHCETKNPTSSETVTVSYATDYVETFTTLGTISTAGDNHFTFPNSITPAGTEFTSIRFRFTLGRGSTTTNTPDVVKFAFTFLKQFEFLLGFRVTIEMSQPIKGRSVMEQHDDLEELLSTRTLKTFTYRDEGNTDHVYYVIPQPSQSSGQDRGQARDESGLYSLTLVQPIGAI